MITTFSSAAARSDTDEAGKFSFDQYQRSSPARRTRPSSAEEGQQRLGLGRAETLARLERQLEAGGLEVAEQDVQVVRIQAGLLGRRVEQELRMLDDVAVDRPAAGDQDRDAGPGRRPARPICCHVAAIEPG